MCLRLFSLIQDHDKEDRWTLAVLEFLIGTDLGSTAMTGAICKSSIWTC